MIFKLMKHLSMSQSAEPQVPVDGIWEVPLLGLWVLSLPKLSVDHSHHCCGSVLVTKVQFLGWSWSCPDFQGNSTAMFVKAEGNTCAGPSDNPDHELALLRRGKANSPIAMVLKMNIQVAKTKK